MRGIVKERAQPGKDTVSLTQITREINLLRER